ncbi:MAG TPA: transcription antitermination factor NusB [Candidatus Paenalcaligenes intestinipullorum]|uniref:Transcription antitermination protein NusB n=1 Tax=Candidatus Paenalcaligenes intestinipullorum TaxID=2838718 RepID=A0A9D2RKW6_9BURK|nr:transcription antitermination factor NusB [Candidatus Paenalcaligenes intestinipullorum]
MILTTTNPTTTTKPTSGTRGTTRSARRRARELALQGIYAWLIRGADGLNEAGAIDAHIRSEELFHEADAEWYRTLLYGVMREAPTLRERFMPYVDRPLSELSPIEHGILLLGSFELLHHVEVPYRVSINEAVELAKEFGGTDGFKFVNGVLDRLAANARAAEVKKYQSRNK